MKSLQRKRIWQGIFAVCMILIIGFHVSLTAQAADAEYRMMRGEQDAIVVGTIEEITEEGYFIHKNRVILCKAENTLSRQLPAEEIPDELLVEEITYHFSYHGRTQPQVGDYIVISVDKEGEIWQQQWLAFEVSSTDIAVLEVAPREEMTTGAYAWQLFISSDGEKVNFAYEEDTILYLDGEVVFDKEEYLKSLGETEVQEQASNIVSDDMEEITLVEGMEQISENEKDELIQTEENDIKALQGNDSVSISIIGGADGPTSVFLAGKLGMGFKLTVSIAVILVVVLVVVIIWKIRKKNSAKKRDN